jgi:hypothetical protein
MSALLSAPSGNGAIAAIVSARLAWGPHVVDMGSV